VDVQVKTKGVFFDLYGTLLIYGDMEAAWSDWLTALRGCLQPHGLFMAQEDFAERCDGFFSRKVTFSGNDGHTAYERRILLLCEEVGVSAPTESVRSIADTTARAWQRHLRLDPETEPVLSQLRERFHLALITNYDHPPGLRDYISSLELEQFFETIVVSAEVGVEKPDPAIFAIALESLDLAPEEVVYVGDMAIDVQGARSAGIRPILIRRDERLTDAMIADYRADAVHRQDRPDNPIEGSVRTITRLSELLNVVETQN
jgi:HAD superfamily hydrolase (TIGR01509 family)